MLGADHLRSKPPSSPHPSQQPPRPPASPPKCAGHTPLQSRTGRHASRRRQTCQQVGGGQGARERWTMHAWPGSLAAPGPAPAHGLAQRPALQPTAAGARWERAREERRGGWYGCAGRCRRGGQGTHAPPASSSSSPPLSSSRSRRCMQGAVGEARVTRRVWRRLAGRPRWWRASVEQEKARVGARGRHAQRSWADKRRGRAPDTPAANCRAWP